LPFAMLISNIDHDLYKGNYAIGKIAQGKVKAGDTVALYWEEKFLRIRIAFAVSFSEIKLKGYLPSPNSLSN